MLRAMLCCVAAGTIFLPLKTTVVVKFIVWNLLSITTNLSSRCVHKPKLSARNIDTKGMRNWFSRGVESHNFVSPCEHLFPELTSWCILTNFVISFSLSSKMKQILPLVLWIVLLFNSVSIPICCCVSLYGVEKVWKFHNERNLLWMYWSVKR